MNHRACILIAYLPVNKATKDSGEIDVDVKCKTYQVFHDAMRIVLEPLIEAGKDGVNMTGGDGVVRKVHPIIAAYVADYPEQCLVTLTKYGTCPRCRAPATGLQDAQTYERRTPQFTMDVIREARRSIPKGAKRRRRVHAKSMELDVVGGLFDPFWNDFPCQSDINLAITPDILHQLYQGVFTHLIVWTQKVMTEEELDRKIRVLSPTFGVREFKNGISGLKQVSGTERKHIAKVLLACLAPIMPQRGIRACKAILDFIYLAQYHSHDEDTLGYMQVALDDWHQHRDFFIDEKTREHFNIPKFHSMQHYIESIRFLGTTDNSNTELFERLHIDFAKDGWHASNKRDPFPQMVNWLSRREKVCCLDYYLSEMALGGDEDNDTYDAIEDNGIDLSEQKKGRFINPSTRKDGMDVDSGEKATSFNGGPAADYYIAKYPSTSNKALSRIMVTHNAMQFVFHLKEYLNGMLADSNRVKRKDLHQAPLPFTTLEVWHQFKIQMPSLLDKDTVQETVKAIPSQRNGENGRFDTVVVIVSEEAESTSLRGER
jgi:hypothetical protein